MLPEDQAREIGAHGAPVGGAIDMSLSFRITISRELHGARIVHGLVGHAGTHRAVADHGNDMVGPCRTRSRATAMPRPEEIDVEECAAPNGSYSLSEPVW